jgi:hypothetical protein
MAVPFYLNAILKYVVYEVYMEYPAFWVVVLIGYAAIFIAVTFLNAYLRRHMDDNQ